MLHAVAMLLGLFTLGVLVGGRWTSEGAAIAAVAAVACVMLSARLRLISGNPFSNVFQHVALSLSQAGAAARGTLATMRGAVAADVTLRPALIRVKSRTQREAAQAAFANLVSAAPGRIVVDTDADGLLVHVTDEESIDAAELGAIESHVIEALEPSRK